MCFLCRDRDECFSTICNYDRDKDNDKGRRLFSLFFASICSLFHSDVLRRQKHVFHLYSMNSFLPCYSLIEINIQRSLRLVYMTLHLTHPDSKSTILLTAYSHAQNHHYQYPLIPSLPFSSLLSTIHTSRYLTIPTISTQPLKQSLDDSLISSPYFFPSFLEPSWHACIHIYTYIYMYIHTLFPHSAFHVHSYLPSISEPSPASGEEGING